MYLNATTDYGLLFDTLLPDFLDAQRAAVELRKMFTAAPGHSVQEDALSLAYVNANQHARATALEVRDAGGLLFAWAGSSCVRDTCAPVQQDTVPRKPLGSFEIDTLLGDAPHHLDELYAHSHGYYAAPGQPSVRIVSAVLRGVAGHDGCVNLTVVEGDECLLFSYSQEQVSTLANLLLAAADDVDAAVAALAAGKRGAAQ